MEVCKEGPFQVKTDEFIILNGQNRHTVRFLSADRVEIDGEERRINARLLNDNKCSLILNDTAYLIDLVRVENSDSGPEQELRVGERTFHLRPQNSRTQLLQSIAKSKVSTTGEVAIRAPMPGLVGKVLTSIGARISAGQGVVILEAMKMENEIRCTADSTVKEIKVKPGQGVEKNQVLAVLSVD